MLLLRVDKSDSKPVYRQITDAIIAMSDSGRLMAGDKLPSSRAMARQLGVSRFTVYRAYQELWSMGYVSSAPGTYTRIRNRAGSGRPVSSCSSLFDWPGALCDFPSYFESGAHRDIIDFSVFKLDESLFPVDDLRRCSNFVLQRAHAAIFNYGDIRGYAPFRDFLARHMATYGVDCDPEDILITPGSSRGLSLITEYLGRSGRPGCSEDPTYSNYIDLMKVSGRKNLSVPMNPDGCDTDALTDVFKKSRPSYFYTMPSLHNPTGVTSDQRHREKVLSLCEAYRVPVIEDGYNEEMKYFDKALLPLKSMDKNNIVFFLGTFSKVLSPGFRLGWILCPCGSLPGLIELKRVKDLSTNLPAQSLMYEFCSRGDYERHVLKMNRVFTRRMQLLLELLKKELSPFPVRWDAPAGGYLVFLSTGLSPAQYPDYTDLFIKHGVFAAPGSLFSAGSYDEISLRLSISSLDESRITEGVKRLAKAFDELYERRTLK